MCLEKELNIYLANQSVLHTKLHNLHWYVSGEGFFTIHLKLEELYTLMAQDMDAVAELLLSSGFKPVASLKGQLAITTIEELNDEKINSRKAMEIVLSDFKKMKEQAQTIAILAEENKKQAIVDLMSGYVGQFEKDIWMLGAYLG